MGVDVRKQVITGTLFSFEDLGKEFLDRYFMKDAEKTFGDKVHLYQLNPWGSDTIFSKAFIVGILENSEDGDGRRAQETDKESIEVLELNEASAAVVKEALEKFSFADLNTHPIQTYRIHYFT